MYLFRRVPVLAASLLLCASAQPPADPSGHWEGTIQVPGKQIQIEIDLAKNRNGELTGTISVPAQNLKGLPFLKVAVDGRSLNFHARADQPFTGVLSADGKSISGDLSVSGVSVPLALVRTGEPKIEVPVHSPPVSKALEGTWNGTLDVNGAQLRLVLTMLNQPDGIASGSVVNLDEGMLRVPVSSITQAAPSLILDLKAIGGSYAAVLNQDGTELAGMYRQGALVVPLTFRHAATEGKK